jgi:hypothetical protein
MGYDELHDGPVWSVGLSRRRRLMLASGALAAAVILVAVAFFLIFGHTSPARSALSQAQQKVTFPLYYPESTPEGFTFDKDSVSATDQVVLYSYSYDGDKRLLVTVQSGKFDSGQFKATSDFTTTMGHAYIVDLDDRTTAAIVGEQSWVIINAPNKIAVDKLTAFINSLRLVR